MTIKCFVYSFILLLSLTPSANLLAIEQEDENIEFISSLYGDVLTSLRRNRLDLAQNLLRLIPQEERENMELHLREVAQEAPKDPLIFTRFHVLMSRFPKSFDEIKYFKKQLNKILWPLNKRNGAWTPLLRFKYIWLILDDEYISETHRYNEDPYSFSLLQIILLMIREMEILHIYTDFYTPSYRLEKKITSLLNYVDHAYLKFKKIFPN